MPSARILNLLVNMLAFERDRRPAVRDCINVLRVMEREGIGMYA